MHISATTQMFLNLILVLFQEAGMELLKLSTKVLEEMFFWQKGGSQMPGVGGLTKARAYELISKSPASSKAT